ncbi:hypothetical protein [Nocardia sp. alder85J]|uniref:hypothetical protein n=1 Tax=Nocardia sp. alder85J TaxID=2862949 RepID=UPI001CD3E2E1|nr:hypothetical protein [Nocardia sp. alder85J]MCX4091008.1 hypothetical protein [Nocardia sp. alder85J]
MTDEVERFTMLASALAGRTVAVAAAAAGGPAWTDGRTVYLDPAAAPHIGLESLAVQASLLAAGGLEPGIVARLARRRTLAERYLAVEGPRALLANERLLPAALRPLPPEPIMVASPAESLAVAASRRPIASPPPSFGVIRPAALLAAHRAAGAPGPEAAHQPRRPSTDALPDLDADEDPEHAGTDPFSSPVGGGGVIGAVLARLLRRTRRLGGGGPPGADAPTNSRRSATGGAGAVVSTATMSAEDTAADSGKTGIRYPEWDAHRGRYRPDWCTVIETDSPRWQSGWSDPSDPALRRSLARLGAATDAAALRRVFGAAAHATLGHPEQLGRLAGPLLRPALDRADIRRRRPS